MPSRPPSIAARAAFGLLIVGVLGAAALGVQAHQRLGLPVPEWPLAFDVFLTVPLAYLLVWRPGPKQALLGLAAIGSVGILLGSLLLPPESKVLWQWLEGLRWVALAGLVAWQLWALAQIAGSVLVAPAGENLEQHIHAGFERRFGAGPMTELLKAEGRMWLYAFCRSPVRLQCPQADAFSAHRQGGNASNQLGFLVLLAVELPVAHVLLHLFSPWLAVAVTAATLYGLLFLFAEYRATFLRRSTVADTGIHLRYGVLADLWIPRAAIVEAHLVKEQPRRAKRRLRLVGMGGANVLLRLAKGTRLKTLFGEREILEVWLGLDEPERFVRTVGRKDA